jgi:hypothetical protein
MNQRGFRYYIRQGWTVIDVPRTNLYKSQDIYSDEFGNELHYRELSEWCRKRLCKDDWISRITSNPNKSGVKQFAFKRGEYATWFTLQCL